MDLKLHLDFCFFVNADLVLTAGWTPRPQPDLVLHAGNASIPPRTVMRFARRDLRSLVPMGFIAVFDLSQEPGANDPSEDLFLAMGREYQPLTRDRLATDFAKMVEIGVDETFFAYVRMIASRSVPTPEKPMSHRIGSRILAAPRLDKESPEYVLSVDQGVVGAAGQGVCTGWYIPSTASPEGLSALVISDRQLSPVELMPGAMPRPDLQPYADRYAFSGRDGWAASFRLPAPPTTPVRLVLMLPGQLTHSGIVRPLDLASSDRVARVLVETTQAVEDRLLAGRLHRGTLPTSQLSPAALQPLASKQDGPILLILDHDLGDTDLRDVLRRVAAVVERPLHLHLLRPYLTEALNEAIAGAGREAGSPIQFLGCSLIPPPPQGHDGQAIFARSSVLFHLEGGLPTDAPDDEPALSIQALDPMANLPGGADPAGVARRFLTDRPPFAMIGPARILLSPFAQPTAFLTPEAGLRQLAAAMLAAGHARIQAAPGQGFLAGNRGPFCQNLIEGVSWHDFDGRSARLISEAA
ncbi:hypothetical protein [Paracoccus sp. T5]|uniref:hypothetical protein n=1 Tax=Paracoccus sp. T5 TaxID=3402161 RepID=UPI003ADEC981